MFSRWRLISVIAWGEQVRAGSFKMSAHQQLFCIANRPFQNAKNAQKVLCSKCYEGCGSAVGSLNFFMEESGLKHHFRTMHRGNVLDDEILGQCKKIFNDLHGTETAEVIKKLSALRLQMFKVPTHGILLKFKIQRCQEQHDQHKASRQRPRYELL